MKVGIGWLEDYIAIPWDPDELADRLTAIGTAVDGIDAVFQRFSGVVAGRIESEAAHPDRSDLHILSVTDGTRRRTIVAGARNCRVGILVPLALPGALLPGESQPLSAQSFAEITSEGMCCSERDLDLSDDHGGLMELDSETIAVGQDIWDALELDEAILSFELTPNRSDCLSVLGIAREIGALTDNRIRRPKFSLTESPDPNADRLSVTIEKMAGCLRYAGRLITGGRVAPSPFWLKRRLKSAGVRAINNAVDITNFVMLESGQPLHAFDWSRFPDGRIVVRSAMPDEEFTTLDGQVHSLPSDAVMITDGKDAVAIGGVMGGRDSEISDQTTDFLLESALFDPLRTRRTRTRLGLATDAALRFEKGVDPEGTLTSLDRAADLFVRLTGGKALKGIVDNYPAPVAAISIPLDPESTNRLLGTDLSTPTQMDYLTKLEFGVQAGKPIVVTVPTFRPDVTRPVDVIEEIARLHGYEKIPVNRTAAGMVPTPRNNRMLRADTVRTVLEGLGFTEIICNSLTDPSRTLIDGVTPVPLRNPLSAELSVLRTDLYGSLLQVVARNRNRRVDSIAVYEIGKRFRSGSSEPPFTERSRLMLGLCGETPDQGWNQPKRDFDFFDLKGAIQALFQSLNLSFSLRSTDERPFRRGDGFSLLIGKDVIGEMGLIDPVLARPFEVKDSVWAASIDFDALTSLARDVRQYHPLPRYPSVYRDLAVLVDSDTPAGFLEHTIREAGGELVESVHIFDRYTGAPVPKGKLSIAFAITYRRADRTLTDAEVDLAHGNVVDSLIKAHNATLRT